jgi:hypothetical protein
LRFCKSPGGQSFMKKRQTLFIWHQLFQLFPDVLHVPILRPSLEFVHYLEGLNLIIYINYMNNDVCLWLFIRMYEKLCSLSPHNLLLLLLIYRFYIVRYLLKAIYCSKHSFTFAFHIAIHSTWKRRKLLSIRVIRLGILMLISKQ